MQNISGMNNPLPVNIEELKNRTDPEAIKKVAKEMEAMFAYEMIKVMRESSGIKEKGSLGSDTYMSMFDLEVSKLFAERGLGLQDTLANGIKNIVAKKSGAVSGTPDSMQDEIKALLPDTKLPRISSGYGMRLDPLSGEAKFHHGLDLSARQGAPIHAVKSGTVIFSGEQAGYGNVVTIDHGDGYVSKYAHNQSNFVQEGDLVQAGSVIAQVGNTGRSTGPHMHFEVRYKGQTVDPSTLLAKR